MLKREFSLFGISTVPFRMVFIMWLVFTMAYYNGWNLAFLGVMPRKFYGLIGIFTAPLIHTNFWHIISNSFPLLFLGTSLYFFYHPLGNRVFLRCYFFPNILVWLFSPRENYHLGASGIIYGLASFLIIFGLLKKDLISVFVSIVIIFLYGGAILYGVLPQDPRVSWEAHLAGALVGLFTAFDLHQRKAT